MQVHKLTIIALVVLAASGCTQWEELPEGATGFLNIDNARLDGTLAGVSVSGAAADVTGYCTSGGWMIDIRSGSGDGAVMSAVDISDLFWGSADTTAVFVANGANRMRLDTASTDVSDPWDSARPASAMVEGCSGAHDGEWEVEEQAEIAIVDIESLSWNRMRVTYEAQFPSGDVLQGSFDAQMPDTD